MEILKPCSDTRTDCNNRTCDGICIALQDTDFKGKPCPFYKSVKDTSPAEQDTYHVPARDR